MIPYVQRFVLIVAECNVNVDVNVIKKELIKVLIVAECNVNF